MSEQGWQEFLSAEHTDDWVVLHGGATAVFRVGSLGEAARLAVEVAKVPGLEGSGVLLTIADDRLTVRLTRDLWQLEPRHVELARAVSGVAREHCAPAAQIVPLSRRCRWRSRRSAMRLTSTSGAPCWATCRWLTTMRLTLLDTDRRSGCRRSTRPRRCGTRCTSTYPSRVSKPRRGFRQRLRRGDASSTTLMRHRTGRLPTERATASVSARGQTGPPRNCRAALLSPSLGFL